jgi:hypothetical protein
MLSVLPLTIKNTMRHLFRRPIVWIPGIYAGCIAALVIWLEFTGGMFLAGKIAMLGAIAFPFFLSVLNYHLETDEKNMKILVTVALRGYFPIVLPVIVLAGFVVVLALLLSVPLSIMGYGSDPFALTGLMLGIGIPALLFSLYIDNVAVCERTKIFGTLKRSMELVTVKIITAIWFFVVSGIIAVIVSVFGAFLWGAILGSRFTQFIEMNLTQQQEVFSQYTLTDWQALIGPEGIIVTALVFGFVTFLLVPILFIFKYECYLDATDVVWDLSGEVDEKGRHFRL